MTDSTPVPRFNWNEEIREYEDADGDECTYKTVVPASDFDRVVAEKNARIEKLEAAIKLQANAARNGMNAATEISRHQVETARRLRAESSPEALESERQANAILTSERDRLQAENVRLAAQAADWSKHPEAQATIGGRARLSIELSIVNDLLAGETDISPMMVEYWHETHDKLQELISGCDSLRAQLAARDERIRGLEEAVEGLLAAFPVGLRNEVQSLMIGHARAALAKGEANE